MVKHTQTIHLQIADKLFECVWPFCGVSTFDLSRTEIIKKFLHGLACSTLKVLKKSMEKIYCTEQMSVWKSDLFSYMITLPHTFKSFRLLAVYYSCFKNVLSTTCL